MNKHSIVVLLILALILNSSVLYADIDYTKDPKPAKPTQESLGPEARVFDESVQESLRLEGKTLDKPKALATWYGGVKIKSDPTGAYIYGEDGRYWGTTSDGYVGRIFWSTNRVWYYTIQAKKPGYMDVKHPFTVYLEWDNSSDAYNNAEILLMVLQPRVM